MSVIEKLKNHSYHLGNISGVGIYLEKTMVLLFGVILIMGLITDGNIRDFLVFACLFFVVFLHEWGHILVARRFGETCERITIMPLGGLAHLSGTGRTPRAVIYIALGGVAVNGILALLGVGLAWLIGWSKPLEIWVTINVILAAFNLLPAFPLDGGRFLQGLLWCVMDFHRSYIVTCKIGMVLATLLGLWALINLYIITLLIAAFIFVCAWSTLVAAQRGELEGMIL